MIRNEIILILTVFILTTVLLISSVFAVTITTEVGIFDVIEDMEQIFTFNESKIVHVKFIDTITVSEGYRTYNSFRFSKTWNVSGFKAYDFLNTTHSLNFTIEDFNSTQNRIIINFPENRNKSYKFVFEFDYINPYTYGEEYGYRYFYWSWGGADYPITLKYSFRLPVLYEEFIGNETYNKYIEHGYTILESSNIASPHEYFEFQFYFRKINIPELKMHKYINSSEVEVGENFIVNLEVYNSGGTVAKNVSIVNIPSPVFKIESCDVPWFGDIRPKETKLFKCIMSGVSASKNEPIRESVANYTDEWGTELYTSSSKEYTITIRKPPYTINFFGINIPTPIENPLPLIYNFFVGYFVLFNIYIIRRKDLNSWNSISTFDKMIYSSACSIINFIFSFFLLITLILLLLPFLFILDLIPLTIDGDLLLIYLVPLISSLFTSYILDKLTIKLHNRKNNIINNIGIFLLKRKGEIIFIYIALILVLMFFKYFL